jgi:hypothetical protein
MIVQFQPGFQAERLRRNVGFALGGSGFLEAGIAAVLDGLDVSFLGNQRLLVPWMEAARKAVAGIRERESLSFQRATVQDAFRATIDHHPRSPGLARPCRGSARRRAADGRGWILRGPVVFDCLCAGLRRTRSNHRRTTCLTVRCRRISPGSSQWAIAWTCAARSGAGSCGALNKPNNKPNAVKMHRFHGHHALSRTRRQKRTAYS